MICLKDNSSNNYRHSQTFVFLSSQKKFLVFILNFFFILWFIATVVFTTWQTPTPAAYHSKIRFFCLDDVRLTESLNLRLFPCFFRFSMTASSFMVTPKTFLQFLVYHYAYYTDFFSIFLLKPLNAFTICSLIFFLNKEFCGVLYIFTLRHFFCKAVIKILFLCHYYYTRYEFFISVKTGGSSLKIKWQQVSSNL